MINLLPEEAFVKLRSDYRKKLLGFGLYLLSVVAAISIVFLVPAYIASTTQLSQVETLLFDARARPVSKQAEALADNVRSINQKVKLVADWSEPTYPSALISNVLGHKKGDISFSYIDLSDGALVLRGRAASRSSFLALMEALKSDNTLSDISSPISNLIATSSLDFSIQMKIVQKK